MPMPQFTVNSDHGDPYKQFKFRVKWDGRIVAGFSRVRGLSRPPKWSRIAAAATHPACGICPGNPNTMP